MANKPALSIAIPAGADNAARLGALKTVAKAHCVSADELLDTYRVSFNPVQPQRWRTNREPRQRGPNDNRARWGIRR